MTRFLGFVSAGAIASLVLVLLLVASPSRDEAPATTEIQLDDAGLRFRVPTGFVLMEENRIVDPNGDVALSHLLADSAESAETPAMLISREEPGIVTGFDRERSLREQLDERINSELAEYAQIGGAIRRVAGRELLVFTVHDSMLYFLRAYMPIEDGSSVSVLVSADPEDGPRQDRQELLFDTVLRTLDAEPSWSPKP